MINQEYIGVLDSGVGGLSVLSELKSQMNRANFIYFGDTKNMPYGTKTTEEIFEYTKNILNFFLEKNVKNVVFACNTTSAVAYDKLKIEFNNKLNIFPLIQSVAQNAIEGLKDDDCVAIMATKATINSKKYEEEIKKYNEKIKVVGIDCTGFVEIVENRLYQEQASLDLIEEKLKIAKENNAKRIVLGCTHYPYLLDILKKKFQQVEYFNPAQALAKKVKNSIDLTKCDQSKTEFFVSKNPEGFKLSAKTFFDIKKDVQCINLK